MTIVYIISGTKAMLQGDRSSLYGYLFGKGNAPLKELGLHNLVNLGGSLSRINLDDAALGLKFVDDRHGSLDESLKTLADAVDVVIGAARGLATVKQALLHDRFGTVKEECELSRADAILEGVSLVELAGKAVNQELLLVLSRDSSLHGILEKLDGDLHGHNLALANVLLDHLAKLAAGPFLLLAKQIAGRQVLESVVAHQIRALGALTRAGTAQNKDDGDLIGVEFGLVALANGLLWDGRHCGGVEDRAVDLLERTAGGVGGRTSALALLDDLGEEEGAAGEDQDEWPDADRRVLRIARARGLLAGKKASSRGERAGSQEIGRAHV